MTSPSRTRVLTGITTTGTPIHIAYRPMWNTFRGRTKLEIQLLDFQVGDLRIA